MSKSTAQKKSAPSVSKTTSVKSSSAVKKGSAISTSHQPSKHVSATNVKKTTVSSTKKAAPVKKTSTPPKTASTTVKTTSKITTKTTTTIPSQVNHRGPSPYPLTSENPRPASRIKLYRIYAVGLDIVSRHIAPVLLVSLIYIVISAVLNVLNIFYFKSPVIINLIITLILFALSIGVTIYYNDILTKTNQAQLKDLWSHWRRIIPAVLVSVATFVLTFASFLPFLLLSGILIVFSIASLNPFKIFDLVVTLQLQAAWEQLVASSGNSINWLIGAGVMLLIGGLVALYVSLNYVFTTLVIAIEKNPGVGSAITYSTYLSKGNKWRLLWMNIFNGIINILGFCCLGIGLLFTLPLTTIVTLVAYHHAKGENYQ